MTGQMAAKVCGKYRGKGRYVRAWVKWDDADCDDVKIIDVQVTEEFYNKIQEKL